MSCFLSRLCSLTKNVRFLFNRERLLRLFVVYVFMREEYLRYFWQYRLWAASSMFTIDGEELEIIDTGSLNCDSGPDFFNAKVRVGNTLWAGNVELHCKASDWCRHGHDADKTYDSVVLHVVAESDCVVRRSSGEVIPQVVMNIQDSVLARIEQLFCSEQQVRCGSFWNLRCTELLRLSFCRLVCSRLERKALMVEELLNQSKGDWPEAFYVLLARNFGMNVNGLPFELLARSLPLRYLAKHKDSAFQVEALVFGQSGLLGNVDDADDYVVSLQKEYAFFKKKFNLKPIDASYWKFARMRPSNSPGVRIAQFANLVHRSSNLFSKILKERDLDRLRHLLSCEASEYWSERYSLGDKASVRKFTKRLSKESVDVILVNTVAPLLFSYSNAHGDTEMQEFAFTLLERLPAEKNSIISMWSEYGVEALSAYDSQALVELKRNFCERGNCLRCVVGHCVLAAPQSGGYKP